MKSFTLLCLTLTLGACDEGSSPLQTEHIKQLEEPDDAFVCLIMPEQMPEFPGGIHGLMTFIDQNSVRSRHCHEGRVYVSFVVETNGSLSDISVMKGVCEECDHNAKEVIKKMPPWIPGRNYKNELSRTRMILPVKY